MKIKYEHDGISLLTKCPHGMNPKVGGTGCSNCDHFGDWIGGNTILCNYKEEEVKHINGPWKVTIDTFYDRPEVRDKDGRRIAVVALDFPMEAKTAVSNARLIASAPDLLEVLEDLMLRFDDDVDGDTYLVLCRAMDTIIKAKGGTK